MLDALDTDYVKLARAKGLSEEIVIWKHALKNAALPVLTFFVILFVMLLGGAVVTETVFAWPGVGRLMMRAVLMRDFPIVQAVVILLSCAYIFANLIVDVLYAWLNPKIRY
jgi:ABC-type dipeptide/oligopeptide/nickel transport system permease component